jgi:hypothetical protein
MRLAMSVGMSRNSKQQTVSNDAIANIARAIADALATAPGAVITIRSIAR